MASKRRKAPARPERRPGGGPAAKLDAQPAVRRPGWITPSILAALAVLVIAIYAQVRSHQFVDLDDGLYVIENTHVTTGLSAENLAWAFTTGRAANWHPLTWMSHQADVSMFGMNAGMHHLTNVAWHLLDTLMLFGLLRSLTGTVWRSAFVAALFAVHPTHVESVAWVSERKDVLSTFFLLASTWAWCAWTRRRDANLWALAFVTFALGLMAKPMLMTLPFAWLLLDYWPLERRNEAWSRRVVEKLPFIALAVASVIVTMAVQQQGGAVASLSTVTAAERLSNAVVAYATYLRLLVWPTGLAAFYPFPRSIPTGSILLAAIVLLGLSALAWILRRRAPYVLVGWLWFLGTMVPVIGLVQIGMQAYADRYTYVPYIGVFIAIIWAAASAAARFKAAPIAAAAGVIAIGALAVTAHAQAATWKTSEVLWTHAIAVTTGNAKAHNLLGAIYGNSGRTREAEAEFKEALRLQPDLTEGLHIYPNLGRALMSQGKIGEAIPYLERARELKPNDAPLAHELGMAYFGANRTPDAIRLWREAVRLDPQLEQTWFTLGMALAANGRFAEARDAFTQVVRINPARQDAVMALQRLR